MKKLLFILPMLCLAITLKPMHPSNPIFSKLMKPTFQVELSVLGDFKKLDALLPKKNAGSLLCLLTQLVRHDASCPNLKITAENNPNKKELVIHNLDQDYWLSYIAHRNHAQLLEAQSIFEWIPDDARSLGYSPKTFHKVSNITENILTALLCRQPFTEQFSDIIHCRKSGWITYESDGKILTVKRN